MNASLTRIKKMGERTMADSVKVYGLDEMKFESLSKNHLTLVDFWAPWCGPCRMMAPVVEELAGEMTDVVFAKVNIDENMELAVGLSISSIPTLVLFKDGTEVERVIGVQPKKSLQAMIERNR